MANSFGGAIAEGVPVIMTGGPVPEVMVRDSVSARAKAFETMDKMGLIDDALKAKIINTMNQVGLVKIVIVPDKPSNVSQDNFDHLPFNVRRIF